MSVMERLGLPDHVVDIIIRQNSAEGLKLEWTVSGKEGQVEVKLKWKPKRGPGGENDSVRKYKSPGNIRRDYYRMKRRLVELNSVCIGTDESDLSPGEIAGTISNDIQKAGLPLSTSGVAPSGQLPSIDKSGEKGKMSGNSTNRCGVKTRTMRRNENNEVELVRDDTDFDNMGEIHTPEKCDMTTISDVSINNSPIPCNSVTSPTSDLDIEMEPEVCLQTSNAIDNDLCLNLSLSEEQGKLENVSDFGDSVSPQPMPPETVTKQDLLNSINSLSANLEERIKSILNK